MLFLKEEERRERHARRDRVIDTNAAFAGGKPAERLVKALE